MMERDITNSPLYYFDWEVQTNRKIEKLQDRIKKLEEKLEKFQGLYDSLVSDGK